MNELAEIIAVDRNKCVNCHVCIQVCPVKVCNIAFDNHVEINSDLCIGCGQCISACQFEARQGIDDLHSALNALKNGKNVVAIVAPAVASNFPNQYLNLNGWLKSLGVKAAFDVSFGAELTIKSYLEHLSANSPKCIIAQPCPALVSYIEIYKPELLPYLAPADSPMMHTIKMVREFYSKYKNAEFIIISPCFAKRREFDEVGLGEYNVTIKKIKDYFQDQNINLSSFQPVEYDNDPAERAVLFSTPGGLLRTAQRENPDIVNVARKIEGPHTVYEYLDHLYDNVQKGYSPVLIDCLNCEAGCNGGTATSKEKSMDELEYWVEKRNLDYQKKYAPNNPVSNWLVGKKLKNAVNKMWKPGLYMRKYKNLHESNYKSVYKNPTHANLENVYKTMLKESEKDHLNCQSCGYTSCEQMASMIFNGINKKENCHVYLNNYLSQSVSVMLEQMNKFSEGDLKVNLQINDKGDIGKLYSGFNRAVERIKETIATLTNAVDETVKLGNGLHQSSSELSDKMNEQDYKSQEISAAVEEMTRTIIETSSNATRASDSADSANQTAQKGKEIVVSTVNSMKRLSEIVGHATETISKLGDNSKKLVLSLK